jgi:hypothetical protein
LPRPWAWSSRRCPKIERQFDRQADLFVSTLRRYIEAMGGRLRIVAEFDDVEVPIDNFREIDWTNPEHVPGMRHDHHRWALPDLQSSR